MPDLAGAAIGCALIAAPAALSAVWIVCGALSEPRHDAQRRRRSRRPGR